MVKVIDRDIGVKIVVMSVVMDVELKLLGSGVMVSYPEAISYPSREIYTVTIRGEESTRHFTPIDNICMVDSLAISDPSRLLILKDFCSDDAPDVPVTVALLES